MLTLRPLSARLGFPHLERKAAEQFPPRFKIFKFCTCHPPPPHPLYPSCLPFSPGIFCLLPSPSHALQ